MLPMSACVCALCMYEFVAYVPDGFSRILWVVYSTDLIQINHSSIYEMQMYN